MFGYALGYIIAFALIYLELIYESPQLGLFAIPIFLYLTVSLIYVLLLRRKISCHLATPINILSGKGKPSLQLRIEAPPYAHKIKRNLKFRNTTPSGRTRRKSVSTYSNELTLPFKNRDGGIFQCRLTGIRIYDFAGIMSLRIPQKDLLYIYHLPEIELLDLRLSKQVKAFVGDADVYDDAHPGYDPTESFGVRAFQDGDELKSVHWKLSAKHDELIVKENSLPLACAAILYVSQHFVAGNGFAFLSSLSFALMERDCPHFVVWESKNSLVRIRVEKEEDFYEMISMYLEDLSHPGEVLGPTYAEAHNCYTDKYKGETFASFVYLKANHLLVINEREQQIHGDFEI